MKASYAVHAKPHRRLYQAVERAPPLLREDNLLSVGRNLRSIYAAPTVEAAEQALEAFAARWDKRFPSISKSWRENWQRVIPFVAYPPEIRKVIYTTNALESINATLRKVTRKRGAFPNPDSVRKVLYLAIQKAAGHWSRPIKDWAAALNHFSIVFEGRVANR